MGGGSGTPAHEGKPGSGLCVPKPRRTPCAATSRSHRDYSAANPHQVTLAERRECPAVGLSHFQQSLPLYLGLAVIETSWH